MSGERSRGRVRVRVRVRVEGEGVPLVAAAADVGDDEVLARPDVHLVVVSYLVGCYVLPTTYYLVTAPAQCVHTL